MYLWPNEDDCPCKSYGATNDKKQCQMQACEFGAFMVQFYVIGQMTLLI